jgi:hypothetical protein
VFIVVNTLKAILPEILIHFNDDESSSFMKVTLIIVSVVFLKFSFFALVICLMRWRKKRKSKNVPDEATLQTFDLKWHIEKTRIDQMYLIGKGQIHKGILKPQHGASEQNEVVAIKTLKLDKNDELTDYEFMVQKVELEKRFVNEAWRMTKLDAHHVVKLKGY